MPETPMTVVQTAVYVIRIKKILNSGILCVTLSLGPDLMDCINSEPAGNRERTIYGGNSSWKR